MEVEGTSARQVPNPNSSPARNFGSSDLTHARVSSELVKWTLQRQDEARPPPEHRTQPLPPADAAATVGLVEALCDTPRPGHHGIVASPPTKVCDALQ